jgi:hypothetical protein
MENLSPVPMCPELVESHLLSKDEIAWLDAFHARCRTEVTAELLRDAAGARHGVSAAEVEADVARSMAWLRRATEPMSRG